MGPGRSDLKALTGGGDAPGGLRRGAMIGGGRATVVEAATAPDGTAAVVKRLRGEEVDALDRARHGREIRLLRTLHHPGLPKVVASGDDWIAMELLGRRLDDAAVRSELRDPGRLGGVLAALAETLAYLHGRGIVHRDLKPANVLFRGSRPVIIDLGAAGIVGGEALGADEIVGSPAWMAPEQLAGAPPDPSVDSWALSAVGLYLLQRRPLYGGDADAVLSQRRAGEAPDVDRTALDRAGPALAGILLAGLEPAPQRPHAAEIARRLAVRR